MVAATVASRRSRLFEPLKLLGLLGVVAGYLAFIALAAAPLFLWQGWLSLPLAIAAFAIVALIFMGKHQTTAFVACVVFALVPVCFSLFDADDSNRIGDFILVIDLVVAVIAAFVVLVYLLSGPRQWNALFIALVCALGGFLFGTLHQYAVSGVPIVRSAAETEAAMQQYEQQLDEAQAAIDERLEETGGKVFLEQSEMDAYDLEGMTEADAEAFLRKLQEKKEAEAKLRESGYTYRDREVQRQTTEVTETDEAYAELGEEAEADAAAVINDGFSYTEGEAKYAKRFAGFHYLWTKLVVIVTVCLALLAYLRQLNWTFPRLMPLPIGGRWLDAGFPKEHRVHLQTGDPAVLRAFIDTAVRKGEKFVLFSEDYLVETDRLPRWSLGPLPLPWGSLEHIRDDDPRFFSNSDFVFEACWFGRFGFSVRGFEASRTFLLDFLEVMKLRRETQATARRTINLVWALPERMPPRLFETLSYCAAAENLRLVVVTPDALPPQQEEHFDGVYDAGFFAALRD